MTVIARYHEARYQAVAERSNIRMAVSTAVIEVDEIAAALEATVDRVARAGERFVVTRGGVPVAVLVPVRDWERLPPDEDWQQRFDALVDRIQQRIPAGITAEEIESDIQAAREEVRREQRAGDVLA
jgi:prevent-host-death family protein